MATHRGGGDLWGEVLASKMGGWKEHEVVLVPTITYDLYRSLAAAAANHVEKASAGGEIMSTYTTLKKAVEAFRDQGNSISWMNLKAGQWFRFADGRYGKGGGGPWRRCVVTEEGGTLQWVNSCGYIKPFQQSERVIVKSD